MERTLGSWRRIYEYDPDGEDVFVANEGVCSACADAEPDPYESEPYEDMENDWSDCFFCGRPITGRRGLAELARR